MPGASACAARKAVRTCTLAELSLICRVRLRTVLTFGDLVTSCLKYGCSTVDAAGGAYRKCIQTASRSWEHESPLEVRDRRREG